MRLQELITTLNETIKVGDHFDFELDDIVIESTVVDIIDGNVVVEADDVALTYLLREFNLSENEDDMEQLKFLNSRIEGARRIGDNKNAEKYMEMAKKIADRLGVKYRIGPSGLIFAHRGVDEIKNPGWRVGDDARPLAKFNPNPMKIGPGNSKDDFKYTRHVPRGNDKNTKWAIEQDVVKSNFNLVNKLFQDGQYFKAKEILGQLINIARVLSKKENTEAEVDEIKNKVSQWLERIRNKQTKTGSVRSSEPSTGSSDFAKNYLNPANRPYRRGMEEAKYQGKEVPLGKKLPGDVKKSKVYVRKPDGKVVKVNFGDKKMRIKKSNPKRRKGFRARHNCKNPGPRWRARYWSCKSW